MPLRFREAVAADLPAIVSLLADDDLGKSREDVSEPLNPRYRQAFEVIAADPHHRLIVAEEAGEVVGTLQLTFLPGLSSVGAWKGLIEAVRVARGRRGQGIGREMIAYAIEQCRMQGCIVAQLATHKRRKDAHRFYEGLGFVATHEGYKLDL